MKIDVTRTEVVVGNGYIVNKGEYKINPCEFTFSEEYTAELVKKAVFDDGKTEKEMAIINNKCDIPYEVLDSDSFVLRVYAYQVVNEELELIYSPTPATVYLREGSYRGVTGLGEVITATQFEQYEQALNDGLDDLEAGLQEVSNVDIDVSKSGNTATVTITDRQGTEKSVEIFDGDDYVLTEEDKQEIINTVEAEVSLDIPTKVSQLENDSAYINKEVNNLTNYYKKNETYTKTEVDNKVSSVYKYRGTVATYNDLPSTNLTIGDVYNVESDDSNYAWNGTAWDKLGGNVDLSNYYTKSQTDILVNAKYTKPSGGIPKSDLTSSAQTSLEKADTAVQDVSGKEDSSNKVTSIDENSTDTQYPSAKTVYDNFVTRDEEIEKLQTENAQLLADHPDILDENDEFPSGTDLTLNGTGDLEMSVDVGGNSTQVQYEGYNLLPNAEDFSETKNGTIYSGENGIYTINTTNSTTDSYVLVNLIKNYTIQANDYIHLCNTDNGGNGYFRLYFSDNTDYTITSYVANNIKSLADYVGKTITSIRFYDNGILKTTYTYKPMILNNVSTVTDFEKYIGGTASPNPNYKQDINNVEGDVEVKGKSKNLFDKNNVTNVVFGGGTDIKTISGSTYKGYFLKCKSGDIFSISRTSIANNRFRYAFTIDEPSVEGVDCYNAIVTTSYDNALKIENIVVPNNMNYIIFYLSNQGDDITNVQLEKGSTATNYVEYKENSVTFPLSQGQKLMLGDTLEDDGIHHKRGKIVFDGTEDWTDYTTQIEGYYKAYCTTKKTTASFNASTGLCTHFKIGLISQAKEILSSSQYATYISISSSIASNSTELKSWLAQQYANGTPVIVEYELETETTETYTQAQQTAYNKLKEMQSYYNLTYVVGSSNNAQPILTAHAKKSIKELSGGDLSNYQTKITSTNKLNSDLVNDTNQTNKFVTTSEKNTWNSKQNATDNNLQTTNKTITSAINEVNSIAKGANQAISYTSYSAMVTAINALASTALNVGQNIYIETLEVPDLWVYKVESTSSSYTYTTDEAITTALETTGYIQVGYYKLSALETQKVDLTNYVENTDYANATTGGVVKISILTQSEYNELQTIDTNTFYMIKEEVLE